MAVHLPASLLRRYRRFSLYNSPYPAHDRACAVDLYPDPVANEGRSPVAGTVIETRTVRCPDRPYAVNHDHLILLDVADGQVETDRRGPGTGDSDDLVARILHVDPRVEPGDEVVPGDSLGPMVRSGFFGPWVDNHVHLGFRRADQHLQRAGGSLPLSVDVSVDPLRWDGTGTVAEVGDTYALLDSPTHPAPCERFVGLGTDADESRRSVALDGGLAHYSGGGVLAGAEPLHHRDGDSVSFLGTPLGTCVAGEQSGDGTGHRHLDWADVAVVAETDTATHRATGISLFAAQDADFGAKLVFHRGHDLSAGDTVRVGIQPSDDPIRLG
ncbi:hypothetical protein [Salinirubrum litoreum]|uniref:Peptidase family M23 n=1 Tax=Salinirubrum litoreum TaxID=1126234 RepID=A0ABD5RCQ2_9EURY|nr:hypothetical protein [Salinirubrum litoreum]